MLNNVIIQGRLTKEIEIKAAQSGTSISNFTVASERSVKNKNGVRETDFVPCMAFGKTAELIQKYFHKGDMILISGRVQTGSYEKDGAKHYTTTIVVNDVNFCGSKSSSTESNNAVAPTMPETVPGSTQDLPFDF